MNDSGLSIDELRLQYRTDLTPNADVHQQRYETESRKVVEHLGGRLDLPYGSAGTRHSLDIFAPETGDAPVPRSRRSITPARRALMRIVAGAYTATSLLASETIARIR